MQKEEDFMDAIIPNGYGVLLVEIKECIRKAQYKALREVNRELISLYWDIGKIIVERQQAASRGEAVVEKLAQDLQDEFPGIRGFSAQNLWRMKLLYESYNENGKLAPLVREIGWTHNIAIFERCKDNLEREFYIRMTQKFGWTKNVLRLKIEQKTYERTLTGQTNFEKTLPEKIKKQAKLAVNDEYMFDFLELDEEHSERELERALVARVEHFLREMGGMFAFLGSQYCLEVNGVEYFVDLLLYHRLLRCLVAVELKIGEFVPEYVGKMQFYLALLDDHVRMADEEPSIGIILCKMKDKTIVEYALRESNKPIGVATYRMVSILPSELMGKLPAPEAISMLLEEI